MPASRDGSMQQCPRKRRSELTALPPDSDPACEGRHLTQEGFRGCLQVEAVDHDVHASLADRVGPRFFVALGVDEVPLGRPSTVQ